MTDCSNDTARLESLLNASLPGDYSLRLLAAREDEVRWKDFSKTSITRSTGLYKVISRLDESYARIVACEPFDRFGLQGIRISYFDVSDGYADRGDMLVVGVAMADRAR